MYTRSTMQIVGKPLCMRNSIKETRAIKTVSCLMSNDENRPEAKFFPANTNIMLQPGAFKGKTAFVTGGGTGLGKGIATMLSSLGANVVIAARRLNVLQETAVEINKITGNPVFPIEMDVRNPEKVKEAFDKCEEKFELPDIIINNAAGNFISPTERLSPNAWKTVIDIVLNGTAFVTLEAGKRLIKAGKGGTFLSIVATYTESGSGFVSPSASAKAGVLTLTKSLASEWARYGMRFNCIAPGPFYTEGAFSRLDPTGQFSEAMINRIPQGRIGKVEEVANLALYLLSDYSNWMTGQVVTLDGGEFNFGAGEMNGLTKVKPEEWDMMEKMIRGGNKADKKAKL